MNKKNKAIIVDLDGTLANIEIRLRHLEGKKDWKSFNASIATDTLNEWCKEIMIRMKEAGFSIIIVSGRVDTLKQETIKWLGHYQVPFDDIYMRAVLDHRSDEIIKKEIYLQEIEKEFDVLFVIDDRARVVAMWRSIGFVCLQCDEGNF